jgi:PEP-CTERM motif
MRLSKVSSAITAGLVALTVTAVALPAHAVVVYSGTVNLAVPNTAAGLYLNVVTGTSFTGPGTFPTLGGPGSNYDINVFGSATWSLFSPGSAGQSAPSVPLTSKGYVSGTATGPASNLALGTLIGGTSVFNTGGPAATALATGTTALLGFRFRNEGDLTTATDDTVHYGWARLVLTNGVPGTLIDYAFESTPLTAIAAGVSAPIPEPASYALFGAGLLGLLAWKQRRQRGNTH